MVLRFLSSFFEYCGIESNNLLELLGRRSRADPFQSEQLYRQDLAVLTSRL
jgi:hypothetical protein